MGLRVRWITTGVLAGMLVALSGTSSSAKGLPTDVQSLFVRTNDRGVTMRVYKSNNPELGVQPEPCSGPGCPPPECVPRNALVIGFSTRASVGEGSAQLYTRGKEPLHVVGTGAFGFEFGRPAAYVVAQVSPDVDRVRTKFRAGGSDEMHPINHLVVLAAGIRDPDVPMYNFAGPSGVIEAFDAEGHRVAIRRFAPTNFAGGQPEICVGGLPTDFPPSKGPPPVNEADAREAVIAAITTAYRPGLAVDQRAALIEDGGSLLTVMNIAADRNPQYRNHITATVDEVQFVDATHAAARFSLLVDGSPVTTGVGRAVLVDGRWLVARDTYCRLQQLGGVWCPKRSKGG